MGQKKPYYTAEFKAEAVKLFRSSGKPGKETARNIGVSESALRKWEKQATIDEGKGPAGALTTSEREELARLRERESSNQDGKGFLKKSQLLLRQGELVGPYEIIEAEKDRFSVTIQEDHGFEAQSQGGR